MSPTIPHYRRYTLLLILLFAALRWITAFVLELGNDEAYYWLYGQDLQWNYFDHPPLVAAWVRIGTLNNLLDGHEGFVRAASVLGAACSSWFMFAAVSRLENERAGWYAALLFNISLYAGVISGLLIMPDAPQTFFWTLALLFIARLQDAPKSWLNWLMLGAAIGLSTMSKVHGIFLWFGLGLYILVRKREWLKMPQLYAAAALTIVIISPIVLWNIAHDFVTWNFHSARVELNAPEPGVKDPFWLETLAQVVVNNPFNMLVMLIALIAMRRKDLPPTIIAYNYIAIPLAAILIIVSIFRDIWFHWSGPAYTTLIPIAAIYLSRRPMPALYPGWIKAGMAFFLLFLAGWLTIVYAYPGTFGEKKGSTLGFGDVTLDKFGWEEAGEEFHQFHLQSIKDGEVPPNMPIVCDTWWGGHVEYYFARDRDIPVIGIGSTAQLHQYAWLNDERRHGVELDSAYCIIPSIEQPGPGTVHAKYYEDAELVKTIPVVRNGKPAMSFYVYRLTGWKGEKLAVW